MIAWHFRLSSDSFVCFVINKLQFLLQIPSVGGLAVEIFEYFKYLSLRYLLLHAGKSSIFS